MTPSGESVCATCGKPEGAPGPDGEPWHEGGICPGSVCPESRLNGEHCNHSWSHDRCCWCGQEWGEQLPSGGPVLTRQQRVALEYLRREGGPAAEGYLWGEGVRPWPTFRNLERKGLARCVGHSGLDEDGYEYELTDLGRVVANVA